MRPKSSWLPQAALPKTPAAGGLPCPRLGVTDSAFPRSPGLQQHARPLGHSGILRPQPGTANWRDTGRGKDTQRPWAPWGAGPAAPPGAGSTVSQAVLPACSPAFPLASAYTHTGDRGCLVSSVPSPSSHANLGLLQPSAAYHRPTSSLLGATPITPIKPAPSPGSCAC